MFKAAHIILNGKHLCTYVCVLWGQEFTASEDKMLSLKRLRKRKQCCAFKVAESWETQSSRITCIALVQRQAKLVTGREAQDKIHSARASTTPTSIKPLSSYSNNHMHGHPMSVCEWGLLRINAVALSLVILLKGCGDGTIGVWCLKSTVHLERELTEHSAWVRALVVVNDKVRAGLLPVLAFAYI